MSCISLSISGGALLAQLFKIAITVPRNKNIQKWDSVVYRTTLLDASQISSCTLQVLLCGSIQRIRGLTHFDSRRRAWKGAEDTTIVHLQPSSCDTPRACASLPATKTPSTLAAHHWGDKGDVRDLLRSFSNPSTITDREEWEPTKRRVTADATISPRRVSDPLSLFVLRQRDILSSGNHSPIPCLVFSTRRVNIPLVPLNQHYGTPSSNQPIFSKLNSEINCATKRCTPIFNTSWC